MDKAEKGPLDGKGVASAAAPVLDAATLGADAVLAATLIEGLGVTEAALCLCDEVDNVRFANPSFRLAFFPQIGAGTPINFVDALAGAMRAGQGIRLTSMTLDDFIVRVKQRRRAATGSYNFALDLVDGSWWWVSDYRLARGWTLVIANEMSSLKREEERLRDAHASAVQAAQTDFLTGIANRRWGIEQAEAALARARAAGLPLTCALLDLDHFKRINDRHGHDAGDRVLVHFTRWINAGIRRGDQLSRFGGEEFLLVLPGLGSDGAFDVLARLLRALPPAQADGGSTPPLAVTASAGLATAAPGETLGNLLTRADLALYEAKAAGRNRVVRSRA